MTFDIIRLFRQSRALMLTQLATSARCAPLRISRIDDPDGTSVIIAAAGTIGTAGMVALWDAAERLDAATAVHVDLHNAVVPRGPWMAELAALGDALEAAGLRVRIVGIDPTHPDLKDRPAPL